MAETEGDNNTRVCHNYNTSVQEGIRIYQNDVDPTVVKILFKSSARFCFVSSNEKEIGLMNEEGTFA